MLKLLTRATVAALSCAVLALMAIALSEFILNGTRVIYFEHWIRVPHWAIIVPVGLCALVGVLIALWTATTSLPEWVCPTAVGSLGGVVIVVVSTISINHFIGESHSNRGSQYLRAGLKIGVPVGIVGGGLLGFLIARLCRGNRAARPISDLTATGVDVPLVEPLEEQSTVLSRGMWVVIVAGVAALAGAAGVAIVHQKPWGEDLSAVSLRESVHVVAVVAGAVLAGIGALLGVVIGFLWGRDASSHKQKLSEPEIAGACGAMAGATVGGLTPLAVVWLGEVVPPEGAAAIVCALVGAVAGFIGYPRQPSQDSKISASDTRKG